MDASNALSEKGQVRDEVPISVGRLQELEQDSSMLQWLLTHAAALEVAMAVGPEPDAVRRLVIAPTRGSILRAMQP